MLTRLLIACLVVLASNSVAVMDVNAQTVAPHFRQFSADDGLPSSEVYFVMEDSKGFMWFGTDNGVARFDGYEFTVFDSNHGLEDVVVFKLIEDHEGTIWVSTLSGQLFYFSEGRFHAWEYNDIFTKLKIGNYYLKLAHIDRGGNFYIYGISSKLIGISKTGEVFKNDTIVSRKLELLLEGEDSLSDASRLTRNTQIKTVVDRNFVSAENLLICEIGEKGIATEVTKDYAIRKALKSRHITSVMQPSINPEGEIVVFTNDEIARLKKGKRAQTIPANNTRTNYIFSDEEDGYWACMSVSKGLIHYRFSDDAPPAVDTILPGRSVSYGTYDTKGGLWLTTLDAGIYYSSHPKLSLYTNQGSLTGEKAFSLAMVNSHSFFTGYGDGSIDFRNTKLKSTTSIPVANVDVYPISWLTYLPQTENLYMGGGYYSGGSSSSGEGYKFIRYLDNDYQVRVFLHGSYDPVYAPSTIYLVAYYYSATLTLNDNLVHYISTSKNSYNVESIMPVSDKLLYGTIRGLKIKDKSGALINSKRTVGALVDQRITEMVRLPHDAVLYGTRGKGIVFQNSDTTYTIGRNEGLVSNMIRDIHRAADGTVWVASLSGISSLEFDEHGQYRKLRTFNLAHGLPDLEVQDIESYGDQIWLATAKGVVRFDQPVIDFTVEKPYIETFFLNGASVDLESIATFPAGRQDIGLSFGAINYQMRGGVPFRYRINSKDDWQYTKLRRVNYPNLNPGIYTFEVQSQNQDGYWSESTVLPFTIQTFWYNSWWARTGFVLLTFLTFGLFFHIRERRHRREEVFLKQINDLERSAVQAQMNPHFIFNSLNSIQYFVLHNDIKQAAIYLSRFAALIRKTLRASVGGEHSLAEEIELLESYLSLEKLRFKDNFTYQLEIDPEVNPEKIKIFPLLIQPFVENAIIHGLKEVDKNGRIKIKFWKVNNELQVDVIDNGSGFDTDQQIKSSSLGMSITRRRLEMMKKVSGSTPRMQIGPMYDEEGNKTGTRATLRVII